MQEGIKRKALLPRVRILLLAVLLLTACDTTVYHRFEQVEETAWSISDTLVFVYEGTKMVSGGSALDLALQVRYNADYAYKNLCMRVEAWRAGDSAALCVDTLCCRMFNDDGRRLGSTAGTIYQNGSDEMLLAASLADTLHLKVSHIMIGDLKGVLDVGVKLDAVKQ